MALINRGFGRRRQLDPLVAERLAPDPWRDERYRGDD
jgi:hypothetical protein